MAKKKDLSIHELAELKNDVFKLGRRAVRGFELANLKKFYVDNHLDDVKHDGHVMEILVAFMLGMIVTFLGEETGEETLEVEMTEADDKDKIDFRLNGFPIQQKFDWKNKEEVCELQEHLWAKGHILLVNIKHHNHASTYSVVESLMDMIRFAELTESTTKGLSKSSALRVSEAIWVWYCDHIKLRDVGLL